MHRTNLKNVDPISPDLVRIPVPASEPIPPVLSLMDKRIIAIAGLGRGSGVSLISASLASVLRQEGLQVDQFSSRMGALHHGCVTRSHIVLIEIEEMPSLWCEIAHDVILIADPTLLNGSLVPEAARFLATLSGSAGQPRVRVVVNRVNNTFGAWEVYQQIRREARRWPNVHLKLLGFIPRDPSAESWVLEQKPLVEVYPTTPASQNLRAMGERLKNSYWDSK